MAVQFGNDLRPRLLPVEDGNKPEQVSNETYDDITLQKMIQKQFESHPSFKGKRLLKAYLDSPVKDVDGSERLFHKVVYDEGDGSDMYQTYYWGDGMEGAFGSGMGEGKDVFKGIPLGKYKNKIINYDTGRVVRRK